MSEYVEVVCIVDWCSFKGRKRVRPVDNTVYLSNQWIECSKGISEKNSIGTKVKL